MALADRSHEEALAQLMDGLRIIAVHALRDPEAADDAVQETVVRVLTTLRTRGLPPEYSLESYTYGTLRHIISDVHRSRRRFLALPEWLSWDHNSALDSLVAADEQARIDRAMQQLDEEDRLLLERCYVMGEKVIDVARRMKQPADRIRKRKSRALQRLRAIIGRLEGHIQKGSRD